MPLQKTIAEVKFTSGLDTRTQPKLVVPGKWVSMINETLTADGTPRRRDAWAQLASQSAANGLGLFNNEALVVNGSALGSVNIEAGSIQSKTGQLGNVYVAKSEIYRVNGVQDSMDCATGGGYSVYAWADYNLNMALNGLKYAVVDEATGNILVSGGTVTASSAICPRVVFASNNFYILFPVSDGSIHCRVISTSTPTSIGTDTAIVSAGVASFVNIDACEFNGLPCLLFFDASNNVTAAQINAVPSVNAGPVTIFAFGGNNVGGFACCKFNNTDVAIYAHNRTTGVLHGRLLRNDFSTFDSGDVAVIGAAGVTSSAIHVCACLDASGNQRVYIDRQDQWGSDNLTGLQTRTMNSSMSPVTSTSSLVNTATFSGGSTVCAGPQGPFIAGKPFLSGTSVYLPVCIMENWTSAGITTDATHAAAAPFNMQNSIFLLDGATGVVAAKALYGTYGIAWVGTPTVSTPTSVFSPSSGLFAMAAGERGLLAFSSGQNKTGTGICRLQFTPNTTVPIIRAQLGGNTFFAGGTLSAYDGALAGEAGFFLFPEGIRVVLSNGAVLTSSSTYQLVVVYEWVDNSGQRQQSTPSPAVSFTTGASPTSCTATVSVPSLMLTQKTLKSLLGQVQIVVYMTPANGQTFYRNGSLSVFWTSNNANAFAGSITVSETVTSNEVLYNQPSNPASTLPNNCPPPCSALMVHQNRLWMDVADDANAFRYSQPQAQTPGGPPTFGLQFNEQLGDRLPQESGGVVGFASMDDQAIIFGARKIYRVVGEGPGLNGQGGSYSTPIEIPSDVGCVEPRSILKMPEGVIFKALKGWHLLGRDLSVRYIGEGVESFNGNSVSGAVLLDDRKECRFSSATGRSLVYSYLYDQWSDFLNYTAADSIWWPTESLYLHVTPAGALNKDVANVWLDGGTNVIVTSKRSSWLKLDKLNGFQRIWRTYFSGTYLATGSDSQFQVQVDFDYGYGGAAAGSYTFTIPSTSAISLGTGMPFEIRHHMQQQKCEAVAFTIIDTPALGQPAGVALQGITLELGAKSGVRRLPAGQSF